MDRRHRTPARLPASIPISPPSFLAKITTGLHTLTEILAGARSDDYDHG